MYEELHGTFDTLKRFVLFGGTTNPKLTHDIADHLGVEVSPIDIEKFANGETYVKPGTTVRGSDVFFVQSLAGPNVNDALMEILIASDACSRASCRSFTAIISHYAYARQDRKATPREPITARLVANLLEVSEVDRIVTLDLHQGQIQGFFDIPVNHLTALPLFGEYYEKKDFDWENTVVVSPDVGRAKAAKRLSDQLGCSLAIAHKGRPKHNMAEVMAVIGDIEGKTCIINDDMIDTAGTLVGSIKELSKMGAGDIYVCATHPIFSGPAIDRLMEAPITEVVVTDSIPVPQDRLGDRLKVMSVAPLFAEAIYHIYTDVPVSDIPGGDAAL